MHQRFLVSNTFRRSCTSTSLLNCRGVTYSYQLNKGLYRLQERRGLSGVLFLAIAFVLTAVVTGRFAPGIGSADSCRRYTTLSACVQDACSRTGEFLKNGGQCSYCPLQKCAALRNNSEYCDSRTQGECPTSVTPKDRSCVLRSSGGSFVLNLTHTSAIEGSNTTTGECYAVGLCRDIMMSRNTCGRQGHCAAPVILKGGSPNDPPWSLGNVTIMAARVSLNLSDGLIIDYGATGCCPHGSSSPGVAWKKPVQLVILPSTDCSSEEDWTVQHVPSLDELKNCSSAESGPFRIVLKTKWLCLGSSRVLWKLSSLSSKLQCSKSRANTENQLQCQFIPVWASTVPVGVPSQNACQRLTVQIWYKDGSKKNVSGITMQSSSASCYFSMAITENSVGVAVIDYNGTRLGKVFILTVPRGHESVSILVIGLSPSVGFCIFLLVVFSVCCWRKRGGTADEHGPLLHQAIDRKFDQLEKRNEQRHDETMGAIDDLQTNQ